MSECRSKTKLVAIYRLEFYKTQKNWKLATSGQERGGCSKKHVDKKANLNATYSIECLDQADSDPLNDAFIEPDSENAHNPSMPRNHEFSQEWQEPVNIWPRGGSTDHDYTSRNNPQQYTGGEFLIAGEKRPNSGNLSGETPIKSATLRLQELVRLSRIQQENEAKEADIYPERHGCADFDGAAGVADWNNKCHYCVDVRNPGHLWPAMGAGQATQVIWSGDAAYAVDVLSTELPECCPAWLGPAGDENESTLPSGLDNAEWAREREREWARERERERVHEADSLDASVDSEGEFMRGADAAPHSSQLDLSVPEELQIPDADFGRLSRMSWQQLLAMKRTARRLQRKLTLESERRLRLRYSVGRDTFPTRDTGLDPPLSPTTSTADRVLAGSHLARGMAGEEGDGCGKGCLRRGHQWGWTTHHIV